MKMIKLVLMILSVLPIGALAQKDKMLHLVIISGANEYVTHITLKEFRNDLEKKYSNIKVTLLQGNGPVNEKDEFSNLDGTDALKDADELLVFARRTTFSGKALEDIKAFVNSGKPVVGLRTASHAFQGWPEFDKEVLGGNYSGHYEGEPEKRKLDADGVRYVVGEPSGNKQQITIDPAAKDHPVLKGVTGFESKYSLYKTSPINTDATLLLTGTLPEGKEPLAWTRMHNGGRVVYIGLGGVQDWKNPVFRKLVTNALFWAADLTAKKK